MAASGTCESAGLKIDTPRFPTSITSGSSIICLEFISTFLLDPSWILSFEVRSELLADEGVAFFVLGSPKSIKSSSTWICAVDSDPEVFTFLVENVEICVRASSKGISDTLNVIRRTADPDVYPRELRVF